MAAWKIVFIAIGMSKTRAPTHSVHHDGAALCSGLASPIG
jgi:hypothetical protein